MRALVYTEPGVLEILDVPEPGEGRDSVMLSVALAGIGGSEVLALRDPGARTLPLIMGHGVVGTDPGGRRVAVNPLSGCDACRFCREDDRQRCPGWRMLGVHHDGGFAERVAVPRAALVPIPDDLAWEQAVFIEPFANAVRAWARSGGGPSDRVAVVGAGSLGLGCVAIAAEAGVRTLGCAEPAAARRAAAKSLGATRTGAALNGTFDLVFDTVGSRYSRREAIEHTAPGGRVVHLGFADAEPGFDPVAFTRAEHTLIGSFVYDRAQFLRAIPLARRADPNWVTGFGLDQAPQALESFARGDYGLVKAAVRP
ncbi:zinc-dependent alcohol dehydrogenase [Streptosporangium sp. G11]|uniref:zinc-dependent alcohol dehydrogenase n=1 Tax=Streptosporangium sp. G11 TaxID=3436926 RepID=UPI003EBC9A31